MDTNQADSSSLSDASFQYYARAAKSIITSSRVQNNGEQSHNREGVQVNPSDVVITISSDEKTDNVEVCQNLDGQVCRICLCSSEYVSSKPAKKNGLIQLGCKCKGHTCVVLVHVECGQAWFNKKGNRKCDICGSEVENIFGVPQDITTGVISGARDTENVVIDLRQAVARDRAREITETNETSDGEKGREYFFAGVFMAFCACLLVFIFLGSFKSR